ncbi:sushi, von Willebrand factor type A, EGF and pentraxin domain-containing protein 1-like isoform X2 [Paramacrobiotus metropolitanus]|nr:sushi, von Willebrand factor type A, EGF and pentraxin domain-containing protein 1-like isoform X2 [Paramacrobiotus metropolitanus]
MIFWKVLSTFIILIFSRIHVCHTAYCGFPGTAVNGRVGFSSDTLSSGTFAAYSCDDGYTLLGSKSRYCLDEGKWSGSLPVCVVNVALNKPVNASSSADGGAAEHGNDGNVDNRHRKQFCVETQREDHPWWQVDLLGFYDIYGLHIIGNADADAGRTVGNIQIRVGNSTYAAENKLCAWIPEALDPSAPREIQCAVPLRGRFVSIHSGDADTVLSFCEAQIFSSQELPSLKCPVQSAQTYVFQQRCYDVHVEARTNQAKAGKNCQDNSGTLVTKVTAASQQFLAGILKRLENSKLLSTPANVWMGLSRNLGAQPWFWHWPNNASLNETFWGDGQPNEFDSRAQVCTAFSSEMDYKWNDQLCNVEANWICQYDPVSCGSPEIRPNSTITGKKPGSKIGETIEYHCEVGNQMIGSPNRTCLRDGNWGPTEAAVCRYVDCGELPKVKDAVTFLLQGRTTYGAGGEYACAGNLSLIGSSRAYCTGDGWSGAPPECRYVNCGFLPAIANGAALLLDSGTYYKARARYECTENYTLIGTTMLTCNENSSWNDSIPLCKLKECPPVPPLINGQISGSNYSLGNQLTYACNEGYYLSSDVPSTRLCLMNQQWSTEAPTCIPIDCGMPEQLANGTFSLLNDGTTYNKTVIYGCESNFALHGDQQRICTLASVWSGTAPKCIVSSCKAPDLDDNQSFITANFSVGNIVQFGCKAGYRVQGVQNYTCHPDGYWIGNKPICHFLDCGPPPVVKHGSYRSSGPDHGLGTIVTYSCDSNTTLLGDSVIYCTETETWSGYPPTCVGCGPPEFVNKAVIRGDDYSLNGTLDYACEPGYKLIGLTKRTCLFPGNWTGLPPVCTEITCPLPPAPVNGTLSSRKPVKVGSAVKFLCNPGNVVIGPSEATCALDGSWNVDAPTCKYVMCGKPMEVKHAKAHYNGTEYGSYVKYICKETYFLHGKSEIFCAENGHWDPLPECSTLPPAEEKVQAGRLLDDEANVSSPKKAAEGGATSHASQLGMGIGIAVACLLVILTFVGSVIWIRV